MKIVNGNNYNIYVFKDHPPPHCHIFFSDGTTSVIDLLNIEPMYGNKLDRKMKKVIFDNYEKLLKAWYKLNNRIR